MDVLAAVSPGLKVLLERVGKVDVINQPGLLREQRMAAVIACNHVGWADSLWMAYAVYPSHLYYMSKQELFDSTLSRWVLEHGGSIPTAQTRPQVQSRLLWISYGEARSSLFTRAVREARRILPSSVVLRRLRFMRGFHLSRLFIGGRSISR